MVKGCGAGCDKDTARRARAALAGDDSEALGGALSPTPVAPSDTKLGAETVNWFNDAAARAATSAALKRSSSTGKRTFGGDRPGPSNDSRWRSPDVASIANSGDTMSLSGGCTTRLVALFSVGGNARSAAPVAELFHSGSPSSELASVVELSGL